MNNKPLVVLINGMGGSGKSTLANIIKYELETSSIRALIVHNADGVKEIAKTVFNWNEKKDTVGRKLLIDITEIGYNVDKHFWEKQTIHQNMNEIVEREIDVIIMADWRYESTYDYFRLQGHKVFIVNIENPNREPQQLDNHHTEIGLKDVFFFDHMINNDGSVDDLISKSLYLVEDIKSEVAKSRYI